MGTRELSSVQRPEELEGDFRTRMEGRLEVVEQAIASWEASANELEDEAWHRGAAWPQLTETDAALTEAVELLERRLRESPQAPEQALPGRLRAAQERVRTAVAARLGAIVRPGWFGPRGPAPSSSQALDELRSHLPIAYAARLGWHPARTVWVAGLGIALGVLLALVTMEWRTLILPGAFLLGWTLFSAGTKAAATPVLLTRRRLVVGRHTIPLEDLTTVQIPPVPRPDAPEPRWELVFTPPSGRPVRVRFAERPAELIELLKDRGIAQG